MTTAEILQEIDKLKRQLEILRSIVTPPKKRVVRQKKDYTQQIRQSLLKTK